uniref:Uncharacterized protein n=1 Tax=Anguilla anguilla TaxID=7936 RepID=A0A0E9TF28_ANGAN
MQWMPKSPRSLLSITSLLEPISLSGCMMYGLGEIKYFRYKCLSNEDGIVIEP